ncbi:zinc-finger of the MIZ type in Nse subunit-domain-containing protein [Mycena floridula]|nr:zinc-finger of the MIZ type in Nse subunit-domain-containing protein [Mycena floridula]
MELGDQPSKYRVHGREGQVTNSNSAITFMAPRRRQPSFDGIEDAVSQNRTQDDVVDDDGDEVSVKKEKKSKKSRKATVQVASNDDDDEGNPAPDDDEEDDIIDMENFGDHPLSKADLQKLQGLATDWEQMAKKIEMSLGGPGDVAISMADLADGDQVQKGLIELENIVKELIDVEVEMKFNQQTIDEIYQKVAQEEEISDAIPRYITGSAARMDLYKTKTTRQKYAKNDAFKTFKETVFEATNKGNIPPITDLIPKEPGDESDSDDELEMGGITQDYKCPITLTVLHDPLTSSVCQHSFSKAALMEMFKGGGSKKCPAAGCTKSFKFSDCKPNKELVKRIKHWERRERRRAEENDDTEVIE